MAREFVPKMTAGDIDLLVKITPRDGAVLEFGCGGSTQFFFENGVRKLCSVESDRQWIETLMENPVVSVNHKYGRWLPYHADIGPVGEWGNPVSKKPAVCWLDYHQSCWEKFGGNDFDLVLIDGRFRVACLCQTLLRCPPDTGIAFHDFWDRPEYHVVLDFVDVLGRSEKLGLFRRKKTIDWVKLCLLLQACQFTFR
ncbi:MAG: hypothetical protein LBM64_06080 [Deltaproteobacteria bacterium]|jgi:hypothetical protein|nr:hypothetical protein [Deltaproteobacteria bacterium]